MNTKKVSISKPIVSISEICQMIQLSRSSYYQLVNSGFFPKPLHDPRSKRPYYDLKLQKTIVECRQSGIGVDGSFMLFYSPRKSETVSHLRKKKISPVVKELTETLESMGLDVTVEQVKQGLSEIYPDGTNDVEQGVVIRELFRQLKQKMETS
jgi:hypothetical protein